jgi:hypothetical protein
MTSPIALFAQDTIAPTLPFQHIPREVSASQAYLGLVLGSVILGVVVVVSVIALRRLRQLRQPITPSTGGGGYTPHFDQMSARESQFYAMTMGVRRPTPPGVPRPTPRSSPPIGPVLAERNGGDAQESDYAGPVHCPACGSKLGVGGPMLRYVTRCSSCNRWVSTHLDGDRITIESRGR